MEPLKLLMKGSEVMNQDKGRDIHPSWDKALSEYRASLTKRMEVPICQLLKLPLRNPPMPPAKRDGDGVASRPPMGENAEDSDGEASSDEDIPMSSLHNLPLASNAHQEAKEFLSALLPHQKRHC